MFFKLPKGRRASAERVESDACRPVPDDSIRALGRMPVIEAMSPFLTHLHMEDGPMFDPYRIPGSRTLHERKAATWALLIGETYSSAVHAEERRRPHRGMLPDVDFSRAVPDHSRPTLVRRIIRLIRPGDRTRAESGVSSGNSGPSRSSNEPVGEMPAKHYIASSKAGDADDSVSPARNAARPQSLAHQSRAA
ncbi:hypothetical protein EN828_07630 [Mesorhizobium sp. M2D.F.Ca.ET.185.01.1.1]|nr:hypothetical protein EN783_08410 [Mesorhizobium sp. M2D.F.Ca.ET.140.01.1.1]TGP18343.1 hypothetical protein EN876_08370 [Mesorhizobium sp. M2D.F.Ca.ET.233.01.1.1]TGP35622.1 hypothetical protein EN875_007630 [Mesorhizobium sp. M2D.F.Ca.ET.232.01.1.1]TGP61128.1 hypothetical protein EN869_007895 [Mesorhizobium sp. M2D.F.Ca.ET.226.01.1.1]TGP70404.1 hypothetical protein EN868_04225 [Mesorhizobium sp. M2D.F.Ca.ET.225.01.1.1]TGP78382.1 hypothetical protein EN867_08370 [Mesorhizobium sp. M2D.F.Ca.ET